MEKEHTHTNTSKLQNEENDFEQHKLSMEIKQHFYDAHFFSRAKHQLPHHHRHGMDFHSVYRFSACNTVSLYCWNHSTWMTEEEERKWIANEEEYRGIKIARSKWYIRYKCVRSVLNTSEQPKRKWQPVLYPRSFGVVPRLTDIEESNWAIWLCAPFTFRSDRFPW